MVVVYGFKAPDWFNNQSSIFNFLLKDADSDYLRDYLNGKGERDDAVQYLNDLDNDWVKENKDLKKAFLQSCKSMGFTKSVGKWQTPLGPRDLTGFELEVHYDTSGEVDDDPSNAIIGVALCSRYMPTFIDWQSVAGSLDVIDLESKEIQIAKHEIGKALPEFKEAKLFCVLVAY